eukprot:TRINITY_DN26960_c0_g2_i1.p1 TRINITY_DN26960_c0_g2~~TRINITY_DN26960_c0_g2_i1.p1  ORF type:complete len:270 (-),score=45.66 TRINITY_DN26960_c0_g2_i1:119-928(-)
MVFAGQLQSSEAAVGNYAKPVNAGLLDHVATLAVPATMQNASTENYNYYVNPGSFDNLQMFAVPAKTQGTSVDNYDKNVNAWCLGNSRETIVPAKKKQSAMDIYEIYMHSAPLGFLKDPPKFVLQAEPHNDGNPYGGEPRSIKGSAQKNKHAARLAAPLAAALAKTKACKFFAVGACRNASNGVECPFAHSKQEQTKQPDLRKTRLCKNFERDRCHLSASECPFAHGIDDFKGSSIEEVPDIKQRLGEIVATSPHENLKGQQPVEWLSI